MDPDDCCVVGLDTDDGPEHPLYDERINDPLDENMVRNIMWQGVIEPIIIRKDGEACQVVAGRRRVRHAREANRRLLEQGREPIRILAINRRGSDAEMAGVMISENEVRKDDGPLAKAKKAVGLMERYGWSSSEAAVAFGVDEQTIRIWQRLLDCDDKVLSAVEQGKLSASAALPLAKLPREQQRDELSSAIESGGGMTAKEFRARARAARERTKAPKEASSTGVQVEDVEVIVAPGKRTIRKVLTAIEADPDADPMIAKVLAWVLGDKGPKSVKGLSKILKSIEKKGAP